MRKGMLITVAGMALLAGTADVRAACIPTQDCASLGYKYTAAQCPDGAIACPFDTSKFFCTASQTCNYAYVAETCTFNCRNVGSSSCVRNGTTYYDSCGSSKCSTSQTCNNGICKDNITSGICCSSTDYCGQTNDLTESRCQSYYGMSCYERCMQVYKVACTDMFASCQASSGTPIFQDCDYVDGHYLSSGSFYSCE